MNGFAMKIRPFLKNGDIDIAVKTLLFALGFKCNLLGTKYLGLSILEVLKNAESCSCKELYAKVAQEFQTTASCVERSIRHCISNCMLTGKLFVLTNVAGVPLFDKKYVPTNGELIFQLSTWIRLEKLYAEHSL